MRRSLLLAALVLAGAASADPTPTPADGAPVPASAAGATAPADAAPASIRPSAATLGAQTLVPPPVSTPATSPILTAPGAPPAPAPDRRPEPDGPPKAPSTASAVVEPLAAPATAPAAAPTPVPDTPDDAPQAAEITDQSAELEAIRRAEAEAKVQEAPGAEGRAVEAAESLGPASPLRDRLLGTLEREIAPPPSEERGRIALVPELDHGLERLQAEYDIPIEVNESVVAYLRFFQSPLVRPHFVKWLGRSHRYLDRYRAILREEGLPEDTVYLAMIESGFANYATSRARAVGPWQFIASTGRLFGLRQDFWVDERRDPEKAARAAARYLKELHQQTSDWRLAWAGYNAGVGTIWRAQSKGYPDFWSMAATKGRRILRAETKGYVPKLMAAAIVSKHPEAFGFMPEEIEPERWRDYEEVEIPDATLLSAAARAAGVEEHELIDLNPELRRACTPPRPYRLKVPREAASTFAERWPELAPKARVAFAGHVVARGETLSTIAARYGVPLQGILELNRNVSPERLRPGTELIIPRSSAPTLVAARSGPPPPSRPSPAASADAPSAPAALAAAPPLPGGSAEARPSTWRVQPGDTLWSISRRLGVGLEELCRWNGIEDARRHTLHVGTELRAEGRPP